MKVRETKMKKLICTLLAVAMLLSGAALAGSKLSIQGSTSVTPLMEKLVAAFPDKSIECEVQGTGSSAGIKAAIEGTADLGMSSRNLKEAELAELTPITIAMDGIAVVVHPTNTIANLTRQQIKDIYTGKISDWSELGMRKGKIVVLSRDTSSGTYEAFETLAINKEKVRPDALINASNQAIASTVGNTPGAIGYIGHGYLSKKVKDVTVDSVACTRENIISGKYPLSRPLFMYTNGKPTGDVKAFIDFVLGKEGKKIVEEEGFVGLK